MPLRSRGWRWFLSLAVAAASASSAAALAGEAGQNKKPSISLKANPSQGMSPLRVVVTAEVKGGADDFADFYCASIEWDWGDGTRSETKADCDPYEAGKSAITRRFVAEHTFRGTGTSSSFSPTPSSDLSGDPAPPVPLRVRLSLKQGSKTVGSAQTTIQIREGIGRY